MKDPEILRAWLKRANGHILAIPAVRNRTGSGVHVRFFVADEDYEPIEVTSNVAITLGCKNPNHFIVATPSVYWLPIVMRALGRVVGVPIRLHIGAGDPRDGLRGAPC